MTLQEIYTKVAHHLLKQNCRSVLPESHSKYVTGEPNCAYRSANKTSCAAGCLIDDEHYNPEMELQRASSSRVIKALVASGVFAGVEDENTALDLIGSLQTLHDRAPVSRWRQDLKNVAVNFCLTFTEPA